MTGSWCLTPCESMPQVTAADLGSGCACSVPFSPWLSCSIAPRLALHPGGSHAQRSRSSPWRFSSPSGLALHPGGSQAPVVLLFTLVVLKPQRSFSLPWRYSSPSGPSPCPGGTQASAVLLLALAVLKPSGLALHPGGSQAPAVSLFTLAVLKPQWSFSSPWWFSSPSGPSPYPGGTQAPAVLLLALAVLKPQQFLSSPWRFSCPSGLHLSWWFSCPSRPLSPSGISRPGGPVLALAAVTSPAGSHPSSLTFPPPLSPGAAPPLRVTFASLSSSALVAGFYRLTLHQGAASQLSCRFAPVRPRLGSVARSSARPHRERYPPSGPFGSRPVVQRRAASPPLACPHGWSVGTTREALLRFGPSPSSTRLFSSASALLRAPAFEAVDLANSQHHPAYRAAHQTERRVSCLAAGCGTLPSTSSLLGARLRSRSYDRSPSSGPGACSGTSSSLREHLPDPDASGAGRASRQCRPLRLPNLLPSLPSLLSMLLLFAALLCGSAELQDSVLLVAPPRFTRRPRAGWV